MVRLQAREDPIPQRDKESEVWDVQDWNGERWDELWTWKYGDDEGVAERECKGGEICGDEGRGWGDGGDNEEQDDKMVDKFAWNASQQG